MAIRVRPGWRGHIDRSVSFEHSGFRKVLSEVTGRGPVRPDPDNDVAGALARLAGTDDGRVFLDWIHRQTHGHAIAPDASEGALRAQAALNSFATKIFNLLDRGLKRDAND